MPLLPCPSDEVNITVQVCKHKWRFIFTYFAFYVYILYERFLNRKISRIIPPKFPLAHGSTLKMTQTPDKTKDVPKKVNPQLTKIISRGF